MIPTAIRSSEHRETTVTPKSISRLLLLHRRNSTGRYVQPYYALYDMVCPTLRTFLDDCNGGMARRRFIELHSLHS